MFPCYIFFLSNMQWCMQLFKATNSNGRPQYISCLDDCNMHIFFIHFENFKGWLPNLCLSEVPLHNLCIIKPQVLIILKYQQHIAALQCMCIVYTTYEHVFYTTCKAIPIRLYANMHTAYTICNIEILWILYKRHIKEDYTLCRFMIAGHEP